MLLLSSDTGVLILIKKTGIVFIFFMLQLTETAKTLCRGCTSRSAAHRPAAEHGAVPFVAMSTVTLLARLRRRTAGALLTGSGR